MDNSLSLLLLTIVIIVYSESFIWGLNKEEILSNGLFWVEAVRNTIFIILIYFVIAILYYFGIKEGKSIRFFSIGALVTTMLFVLTTYLFGVYIPISQIITNYTVPLELY